MEADLGRVFQLLCAGSCFTTLLVLIENLVIFRSPTRTSVLQWKNFERDLVSMEFSKDASTRPIVRKTFSFLFANSQYLALHLATILLELQALWFVFSGAYDALLPILGLNLLLHMWLRLRFLGPFCGGADAMAFQLALVAFLLSLLKHQGENFFLEWAPGLVIYLGVQVGLSYFLAGVTRLREKDWLTGAALMRLLNSSAYGFSPSVRGVARRARLCAIISIGIILFELMSPAAFFAPQWSGVYIGLALVFHLCNAWILGLNRFVWAWGFSLSAFWFLGKFSQHFHAQ